MDPEPGILYLLSFTPLPVGEWISLVSIVALLLGSALISGSEVAFFSLTNLDFERGKEKGSKKLQLVEKMVDKPKKLLATLLISNNFINIAIVLLFESFSQSLFGSLNHNINLYFFELGLDFLFKVIIVTSLLLLFGEIIPKVYASRNKVPFSSFVAYPVYGLYWVLSPLTIPMRNFTLAIQKRLGRQKSSLSVGHLSQALDLASEEDTTHEEKRILKGIVSFGNTDTKQVMRPRLDMFALSYETNFSDLIEAILKHGYSRVPVYSENLDQVVGILYVKDLLPYLERNSFDWTSLLREPYFVPENKKLDDLLKEFQERKIHLAIVVDEFGGTSGLITLEDIIEEIVGDISDEFDDEDLMFSKLDENTYVFEGKTNLRDFYRVLRSEDEHLFEDHKGESETLAGFILELSGAFPKKGEKIILGPYTFTIESMDKRRIKQIKVSLNQ